MLAVEITATCWLQICIIPYKENNKEGSDFQWHIQGINLHYKFTHIYKIICYIELIFVHFKENIIQSNFLSIYCYLNLVSGNKENRELKQSFDLTKFYYCPLKRKAQFHPKCLPVLYDATLGVEECTAGCSNPSCVQYQPTPSYQISSTSLVSQNGRKRKTCLLKHPE